MKAALPDLSQCRRALIIKPSSLGDLVHTLPAIHLLKQQFPQIEFTWLAHPAFAPLLDGNSDLRNVIEFPRGNFRGLGGLVRFRRWLTGLHGMGKWDLALDFQGLLRSGLIARASRAPASIGLSDSREGARWFHNHIVRVDPAGHAIDRYLALPRALGADGPAVYPLPQGNAPSALPGGEMPAGAVLLHPFSRGKGKSLSVLQTVRLCQALAPLPVLLVGQWSGMVEGLPSNVIPLLNATTLPELIWLMRRARGVMSVDSGPMHIAAALPSKVLGIHTWSDPRKVGPWHPGTTVWKAGRLMGAEELDPEVCGLQSGFPDEAVGQIAGWAHQLPG